MIWLKWIVAMALADLASQALQCITKRAVTKLWRKAKCRKLRPKRKKQRA